MNKPIPDKLSSQIDTGVKLAIAKAVERHRKLGESISIWQDGKVVTLTAEEIPQFPTVSEYYQQFRTRG
ncbi:MULTISPECIES: hypothetical protein [Planktothrix]|jgi:hypothetical protein|uniref:Uncharacterized protein n=3 Tax=Planktothrix TaxID=54304 RepID=A0A073CLZ0_PLAA1|nr:MULTISPECIES: hypothetical protein [Planktothrix]CAD5930890.1 hypothetical protein NO108_01663 [Planktothrix rubescens]KEI69166.1 hypothetical protein A19Y_4526 [Planktothrix agardhii NIVA-CYA 126/8]MCB8763068.1 hypothetical protein [Planktothrix agardhii 1809]MCB8766888.1 hypothetical protein [Planktothrix agardhii 1809]MCB8779888.1 hypothetical protein [Planktothrix agardhii 1031]